MRCEHPQSFGRLSRLVAACAILWAAPARANDSEMLPDGFTAGPSTVEQLGSMSLEDLMSLEITSVSKQKQRVSSAPAAVSVITPEDIRRSGMTSIPELLRLSPGLNVARVDGNKWAIGSRGF